MSTRQYKENLIIDPKDDLFANFIHERVNLAITKYCNSSPRGPSWSVGKLEFYCDRNSLYNMIFDFDPNRPNYFKANKDGYGNIFSGMVLHDVIPILDYQEVNMEFEEIGGHFDDLSACGRWLVDKKTLTKVENWTNQYLPRESHCRQITFYRVLAHFGTLKEPILDKDGEVVVFNGVEMAAGAKPKFNIKKAHIVYMPMNAANDVRVADLNKKWMDIPIQAAAQMLLGKKDRVEEHMLAGTFPERAVSYECKYCQWYADCWNTGDYDKSIPEYLDIKLQTMSSLGGGGE